MQLIPGLLLGFVLALASAPAFALDAAELRCGWFENPTPGNAWLSDRDGEWLVGLQGGHQAEGQWPDFAPGEWVRTNRAYGYGCTCLEVLTDSRAKRIERILGTQRRVLDACRDDPALSEPSAGGAAVEP
ncbi:DUF4087 domain-containing protein [Alkalilimnicola sp. S0819]|nr:DUF4087 domain-containing protein [Alkalilimnicola sp. S0819]MPQ15698.1 DUF4087 domain-containing protein [Alkalilimnicola sp. S0819]